MRTEQDKINRRDANRRFYKLKENREARCAYQQEYSRGRRGPKQHEPTIYPYHEEWAKKNGYRDVDNDQLNIKNSERFINYEKEKNNT